MNILFYPQPNQDLIGKIITYCNSKTLYITYSLCKVWFESIEKEFENRSRTKLSFFEKNNSVSWMMHYRNNKSGAQINAGKVTVLNIITPFRTKIFLFDHLQHHQEIVNVDSRLTDHKNAIHSIEHINFELMTVSSDMITIWNNFRYENSTGKIKLHCNKFAILQNKDSRITVAKFVNCNRVIYGAENGYLYHWSTDSTTENRFQLTAKTKVHESAISSLEIVNFQKKQVSYAFSGGTDGSICILKTRRGKTKKTQTIQACKKPITSICTAFIKESHIEILTASKKDPNINALIINKQGKLANYINIKNAHVEGVNHITKHDSIHQFATCGNDKSIKVWEKQNDAWCCVQKICMLEIPLKFIRFNFDEINFVSNKNKIVLYSDNKITVTILPV